MGTVFFPDPKKRNVFLITVIAALSCMIPGFILMGLETKQKNVAERSKSKIWLGYMLVIIGLSILTVVFVAVLITHWAVIGSCWIFTNNCWTLR